jgi:Protein kinase domain
MPTEFSAPEIPFQVGPFKLVELLGAGMTGPVYLGLDAHGRAAAVKLFEVRQRADEERLARFGREIDALRKLTGVHGPRLLDSGVDAGRHWLATPYIAGPDLAEAAPASEPLPLDFVLSIGLDLCDELAAIHGAELLHRDLKPQNVMIGRYGAVIVDLGLARLAAGDSETPITRLGHSVGTPGFMAPEQITNMLGAGTQADVYGLGATLLAAATGHSPFPGTQDDKVDAARRGDAPDLGGLPAPLYSLILSCLRHNPGDRPTVSAVRDQLTAAGAKPFAETIPAGIQQEQERIAAELSRLGGLEYTLVLTPPQPLDPTVVLAAAARVVAQDPTAEVAQLIRLASLGGLTVDPAEGRQALTAERAAAVRPVGEPRFAELIGNLSDQELSTVTLVELAASGCLIHELTATSSGEVLEDTVVLSWRDLLHAADTRLARDRDEDPDWVKFLLAAGPDAARRSAPRAPDDWEQEVELAEGVADIIARKIRGRREQGGRVREVCVVLRRAAGWALLDQIARLLAPKLHPELDALIPGAGPIKEYLKGLLRQLPPRRLIELAVAEVDDATGRVSTEFITLFDPAEASTHTGSRRTVRLSVSDAASETLLLPVVSRAGPDEKDWDVLHVGVLDSPAPGPLDLTVELGGRAEVRLDADGPTRRLSSTHYSWADIRRRIPDHLRRAVSGQADLVVALELGSSDKNIERRRKFAAELVDRTARLQEQGLDVRVAVLSYGDHRFDHAGDSVQFEPRIEWTGFTDPAELAGPLAALAAVPVAHDLAAPVEHVLDMLGRHNGWRKGAQRAVVFVGSRPPHPARPSRAPVAERDEFDKAVSCPQNFDWTVAHSRITGDLGVLCAAVLEPLDAHFDEIELDTELHDGARRVWRRLVGTRLYNVDRADADAVLAALGIGGRIAANGYSSPLPLARRRAGREASRTPLNGPRS